MSALFLPSRGIVSSTAKTKKCAIGDDRNFLVGTDDGMTMDWVDEVKLSEFTVEPCYNSSQYAKKVKYAPNDYCAGPSPFPKEFVPKDLGRKFRL